ncbi:PDDEXK family nuclease [Anaeromicropila herbilytica]|uniref:EVE domain-containing protein n=1 Tax=Anaeromicropila herbilytica TaxID=2785025 RepID=A0A7R7EK73_9FIRM|nr:hypothetical protein [Anaeromicropila herbilytica]BCN30121.1 hypothetical protein bsdtb5_14160 [Anaeromicropila herbilytica]
MLFYLDDSNKKQLNSVKRINLASINWREKDLEDLIAHNISKIVSESSLMTIFQERKGKEEPDIMALDRSGSLYLFELKRWKSDKENLLQVLRYGQIFGQSDYNVLNDLYNKHGKKGKELIDDHKEYFNLGKDEEIRKEDFNKKQHFLIITDGTDTETRQAINYWKTTGLWIDAIIYRVYETLNGGKLIEFNTYSPEEDVIEFEEGCYILNTNTKNTQEDDKDMIQNKKAAAYYDPWKTKINKIQKGDKVFLYRNATGIVAMGKGSGIVKKKNYHNLHTEVNEEYYTELEEFMILKTPLKPDEIKQITGVNYRFMSTMFGVGQENGNKIWEYIIKNSI